MAQNNNLITIGIVALAIVLCVYFITTNNNQTTNENIISATGTSTINVEPDTVSLYINIETRDSSADVAKNQNSDITSNVKQALSSIGIQSKEIQTLNYNIYPEYDWSDETQNIKGYVATNTILVKTKDFDKSGSIIDAAVDNGALIGSINFELSQEKLNEYKTQVITLASQDAKSKAEALASGVDKNLGELVSISTSDYDYTPYPLYVREETTGSFAANDAKEAATDITPRDLEVRSTVSVNYKIS